MERPKFRFNLQMIKDYIINNNLTNREFCKRCNITEYIFTQIINGRTNIRITPILKILKVLKIKSQDIIIFEE